jgi:hypothetical protein
MLPPAGLSAASASGVDVTATSPTETLETTEPATADANSAREPVVAPAVTPSVEIHSSQPESSPANTRDGAPSPAAPPQNPVRAAPGELEAEPHWDHHGDDLDHSGESDSPDDDPGYSPNPLPRKPEPSELAPSAPQGRDYGL